MAKMFIPKEMVRIKNYLAIIDFSCKSKLVRISDLSYAFITYVFPPISVYHYISHIFYNIVNDSIQYTTDKECMI